MNTKNILAIHFVGIDANEMNIFNRVLSFNATHGQELQTVDAPDNANLIVSNKRSFSSIESIASSKTCIVLSNDDDCDLGDFQITRPLMITKVMNTLSSALEKAADNPSVNIDTPTGTNNNSASDAIDNFDADSISGYIALVIDDSAAIRKQLELELRDAGIKSEFAESGEEALEIIKNKHFDLVFLDIIMPGIDGYETCKEMRSVPEYKKTPIIMLSGKTSPLDEVKGVIAGATTYLTKPVASGKLQETLNRVTKWIENFAPTQS